jgi:D-beta-D-heptose 7-phosphate kinase/D-beta-D-heptose 1-phosphate adenosyltransferase
MIIVSQIKNVNKAILSVDQDRTVCETIKKIVEDFGHDYEFSFANGGDQNNNTIPEKPICKELGVELIDGLGDKIQSSSWLLNK